MNFPTQRITGRKMEKSPPHTSLPSAAYRARWEPFLYTVGGSDDVSRTENRIPRVPCGVFTFKHTIHRQLLGKLIIRSGSFHNARLRERILRKHQCALVRSTMRCHRRKNNTTVPLSSHPATMRKWQQRCSTITIFECRKLEFLVIGTLPPGVRLSFPNQT